MDRIKLSDELALQILYDRLWERMYLLAYAILKDKDKPKDIIQEVWISIWKRRAVIENYNIEAYIIKASCLRVYKELRDSKSTPLSLEFLESIKSPNSDAALEALYKDDLHAQLEKSIDKLPKKCQEVFVLSRHEGINNAEISNQLDISQRTVETHISNAIRKLKSEVLLP
tara:strand:+ start:374 stop:886 length:513 start_codon:yes stop_codon:yes gene_type:complete